MADLLSILQAGGDLAGMGMVFFMVAMFKELKYLRRDTDHAHKRIDHIEGRCNAPQSF